VCVPGGPVADPGEVASVASTFGRVALGQGRMEMAVLGAKKPTYSTRSVTSKDGTTTGFRLLVADVRWSCHPSG
jgi:hypothetical protein